MSATSNPGPTGSARLTYRAEIERILNHNADTRSLFLRFADSADFTFIPGQFISLALPLKDEVVIRPYSIASSPEDGQPLEICLNLVPDGVGSRYLFNLNVGDSVSFTGPFGRFTLERAPEVETIFVADATAIAPMRPMIRRALSDPRHPVLRLHHSAAREDDLIYRSEFDSSAAADSRFSFEPMLTEPPASSGERGGMIQLVTRRYITSDDNRSRQFYICGVGKAVFDLRDLLRGAGYERRAVQYERW